MAPEPLPPPLVKPRGSLREGQGPGGPHAQAWHHHSGERWCAEEGVEVVPTSPRLPPALRATLLGPAQEEPPGMACSQGLADNK